MKMLLTFQVDRSPGAAGELQIFGCSLCFIASSPPPPHHLTNHSSIHISCSFILLLFFSLFFFYLSLSLSLFLSSFISFYPFYPIASLVFGRPSIWHTDFAYLLNVRLTEFKSMLGGRMGWTTIAE